VNLLYLFPDTTEVNGVGDLVLDWGGRNPFAHSHPLESRGAIAYPQIFPGMFSAPECAAIIALGEARVRAAATVDDRSDLASRDYRVSDIAWIEPAADSQWLYHRLGSLFGRINASYGFELVGFVEPLQFTCYGAGQYFGWHVDIGGDTTSLRKLSLTIQLSAADDYQGGDLQFHGAAEMPAARAQGTAVAFPSYLAHQVSPVTRGLRRSLVAWAYGPAFR
jgi:PKHD-type hydroxylase